TDRHPARGLRVPPRRPGERGRRRPPLPMGGGAGGDEEPPGARRAAAAVQDAGPGERRDVLLPASPRGHRAAGRPAVRPAPKERAVTAARPRLIHLTTVDMSLVVLLAHQLVRFREEGFDVAGASAPGPYVGRL